MTDRIYRSAAAAAAVEARYLRVLAEWPVPNVRLDIGTRQGRTFVLVCGPQDAPPVVLLHGAQANSAAWLPDIERWSARFRLYAVDLIGEAGFSAPVRPKLDDHAYALWLDDVFAGLDLSHASLVGVSLGGWLALDYACRRPHFADALALVCPAGIGRQKHFLLKVLPLLLLGSWGRHRIRALVFGPKPAVLPAALEPISELMEQIAKAIRPRVIAIPRLTDAQLESLVMPVLTIIGGRDVLIDSRDTRTRLQRHVPHAEVCFIDEGYHFLPDQTGRVMDFLERATAPGVGTDARSPGA